MTALALSDLHPKRSWLFWLGTLICLSAAIVSAALNAYAVQWLMPHGTARVLGIAASVALDAWKVLTPVLVLHMWQARMRLGSILCGLAGIVPFAISLAMAASFSVVTRADAVTQHSDAAVSRDGLRTGLQSQESQIKVLGVQRPVAVVDAELQSQAVPPSIWRESNECRVLNSDYWQRACRDVVRIRKELAAAKAYEKATNRVTELRHELSQSEASSTDVPIAELVTELTGFDGKKGAMWYSVVFAAAFEIVAGLGFAFVHLTNRAQWRIRQQDLVKRLSSAQLGAIDVPSSASDANSNSVSPRQQLSFHPESHDPTLAKVGCQHDPVQLGAQPSLQSKADGSSAELEERSNPVKPGVQPSSQQMQPSSPLQPGSDEPSSPNTADGAMSKLGQPNRTPSRGHDTTQVAENRVRHKPGVVKLGNRAERNSVSRSAEEAALRTFLVQLTVGPGLKTQAAELHREYLRRARAQGWPMLNSTAFGRLMTILLKELGFEKRKEGKVTMYFGISIAMDSKIEPPVAAESAPASSRAAPDGRPKVGTIAISMSTMAQ
jgi:hypothetical protein